MNNGDKIFKFILKCQKNYYNPDLHTFIINTSKPCGQAYVECRKGEVFIEHREFTPTDDKVSRWCGTAVAAANRLEQMGADYISIDM